MENLGRYRLLEWLGADAFGELLRARDSRVGRTVALRVVAPSIADDETLRKALLSDAAAARALSHPNVAALFDSGEEDGRVYLAHEFVAGRPLDDYLMGTPLSAGRALEVGFQLADGVAEGHRLGLAHACLCGSTVYITDRDKAKILDFGLSAWTDEGQRRETIARQLSRGERPAAPDASRVVADMPPEQILTGRADQRSDIYSLGALVYQMVTGRNPFRSVNAEAAALNVLRLEAPPAFRSSPVLPAKLDAILARAMAKSPKARYASAAELAADLRALAGRDFPALTPDYR